MPLGYSNYGQYGYFDIPGAFSGYEDALTKLVERQQEAGRMQFPDFMRQLAGMLMQRQERGQEQERWQQEFDVNRQYKEALGGLYQEQTGLAREKFEYAKGQPPAIGTAFQDWRRRNPTAPVSEWLELNRSQAQQQPTAYQRNYAFDLQNLMRGINKEQQGIVGPSLPTGMVSERAEQQLYDKRYGEKPTEEGLTIEDIKGKYMSYVAGVVKQNQVLKGKMALGETEKTLGASMQPIMSLDEYTAKFKQTGKAPKSLTSATQQKKAQIDTWLGQGHSKEEIRATIEAERDRLTGMGIDIEELLRHMGF